MNYLSVECQTELNSCLLFRRKQRRTREKRGSGDEAPGTMGRRTTVFSFTTFFARKFTLRERRLGTRQIQVHNHVTLVKFKRNPLKPWALLVISPV